MSELCFDIDGEEIYLDKVLVDYEHVPLFFVCSGANGYYISLCTDIEQLTYIVANVSRLDLYEMLQGHITMRDVILRQKYFYEIESADEVTSDIVTRKPISEINDSMLPYEGAYFEAVTDELRDYVEMKSFELLVDIHFSLRKTVKVSWFEQHEYSQETEYYTASKIEGLETLVA